jgi:mono/diheme cytochrome c family protein
MNFFSLKRPRAALLLGTAWMMLGLPGCSRDMAEQPSFQPQEAPRLHSPEGSLPRKSRSALIAPPPQTADQVARGAALFDINCSHCHGKVGLGDGPVGRYLVLPPFNLRAEQTQQRSEREIYEIITDGRVIMPAFKGVLSAEERWAVVYFVKSLGTENSGLVGRPPLYPNPSPSNPSLSWHSSSAHAMMPRYVKNTPQQLSRSLP